MWNIPEIFIAFALINAQNNYDAKVILLVFLTAGQSFAGGKKVKFTQDSQKTFQETFK